MMRLFGVALIVFVITIGTLTSQPARAIFGFGKPKCKLESVSDALFGEFAPLPGIDLEIPKKDGTPSFPKIMVLDAAKASGSPKIVRIEKLHKLGEGLGGTVYKVKVYYDDQTSREMAWKETKISGEENREQDLKNEREGMDLQYRLLQSARQASSDGSPTHILPVELRITLKNGSATLGEGFLMALGRDKIDKMVLIGGKLSLLHSTGRVIPGPTEARAALQNIGRFARDTFYALAELSQAKIVHRDLKGRNFVIVGGVLNTIEEVEAGIAHFALLDFDKAVPVGSRIVPGHRVGTPSHMAPEVGEASNRSASPALDIYSAAVMLAEALTGESPNRQHKGFSPAEMAKKLGETRGQLEANGASSGDLALFDHLAEFVEHGLEQDPPERIRSFTEDPSVALRISTDGRILGPSPELVRAVSAAAPH